MERELSLERYVLSALRGLTQRYNSDRLGVANEEVRRGSGPYVTSDARPIRFPVIQIYLLKRYNT